MRRFLVWGAVALCAACTGSGGTDAGGSDGGAGFDAAATDAGSFDSSFVADGSVPMFVNTWGNFGTLPGEFIEPSSVELDTDGFVYVAGHEDRFQKFTPDGMLVAIYGMAGVGDGEFNHPHGLAIDRARGNLIYIGDQNNGRVQVFLPDGTFVLLWSDPGFVHIHDVGIDPATGDIFVGDYTLDLVQKFTAMGTLLATYGGTGTGPGEFDGAWGISTDSVGDVFVADTFNARVQKLDRDGVFLTEWSGTGLPGGDFIKPTGVFVDATDTVYVCDALADAVVLFDGEGNALGRWDLAAIVGSASEPEDIVIDAAGEHIYVADVLGHRVLHLMGP